MYFFYQNIFIKNINQRVSNGLKIFTDSSYQTRWDDFPTDYFNKYYQETMSLKMADYYWASSRKSYLPVGESWDFPAYEAIQKVLEKGARVIHLDIFSDEESVIDDKAEPIVRNTTISPLSKPLNFKKCLDTIRRYAWKNNADYPLILYLEIHSNNLDKNGDPIYNKACLERVGRNVLEVFSDKLINKMYGFNGRNNKFTLGEIPIKDVLGRVVILTNVYPSTATLNEITNGVINEEQQFNKLIPYSEVNKNYGGLRSTLSDKESVIRHNYKYLSVVNPVSQKSLFNFFEPKDDIYNIPPQDAWDFGCQIVLMNYQLLDTHMKDYLKKFDKSSLVLKPEKLRYIPQPPQKVKQQEEKNYYAPRKFEEKGWFNHDI